MTTRNQPLKRSQPKRSWEDAKIKRGPCRVCGSTFTELAHTFSRELQDEKRIGSRGGEYIWVNPDSVIPLCGPMMLYASDHVRQIGQSCHRLYDNRDLSLIGYLTFAELRNIIQAVGKHRARRRLSGGRS